VAISGCGGILKWLDFGWGQSLYLVQPYENTMTIFLAWRKKISSHLYRWLPNNLRCYPDPNAFLSTLVNSPMTWKCILLQALKHTVNSMLIQGRHWILVSIGTRFHLCSQAAGSHTVRWSRDGQFCTQRRQHTLVRLWHQHHHWLSLHLLIVCISLNRVIANSKGIEDATGWRLFLTFNICCPATANYVYFYI